MTLTVIVLCVILAALLWMKREPRSVLTSIPRPKTASFIDTPECRTAVHEAGHAVAAWSCTCVTEVDVATIETDDGGLVQYTIHSTETPDGMWCRLVIGLAGVAAETFVHGKAHSSASESDLTKARLIAEKIAASGWAPPWKPLTGSALPFEELFNPTLKAEEVEVFKHGYRMARHVVRSHDQRFHRMVTLLLTHKTVSESDVEHVLGKRSFTKLMGLLRPAFIIPKRGAA